MKSQSSLLHKTLLAISIILLPIVISFVFDYYRNKEQLGKGVLREMTVIAEGVEGQVYQFLELSKRGAYDFASDGFIRDTLTKINTGNKDVVNTLNAYLINEKWILDATINRINIISMNGRVVTATDFLSIGKDVSEEEFFKKGLTGTNIIESYRVEDRPSEIAVTSIIRDRSTHTPIGLLVNFVSVSALNDVLRGELNRKYGALTSNMERYRTLKLYLVNKDYYMLTVPGLRTGAVFNPQIKSYPVQECLEDNGKEFSGFYKDYRGIDVAGASMCIPSLKWTLLAELDANEGFAPLASMRSSAMTSGSVVIGLILLFSIYIFKKVVLPLRRVYAAAENIAGGDYDTVIPVETGDEIGKVSHSINQMARDIKERTKLLIENEGQFRSIIDNSETVIYLKDIEGRYILINRKYEELFNITKEGIKGKTDFDIFPENMASSFRANDLEVLKVKRPVRFEEFAPHKDGIHYYLSMKVPVFDSYGIPFATCGISTDITERKQVEDENNLLKNISMSIARSVDFDSALREVLARVCEFTNWISGEAWFPGTGSTILEYSSICYYRDEKGKKLCDLSKNYTFPIGVGLPGRVWQTKRPEWLKDITNSHTSFLRSEIAAETGIKAGLGVPIIAGNSVLAVLTFFMSDVREEDERVINIVQAVTAQLGPIFQHKHAEDLRYEIQQRYEALVNSLDVGIFRGTPDGRVLEINQAVVTIYEAVSIQELLGYNWSDLFYDRKRYDELISEILESGFIKDAVVECKTLKGKRFWASVSAVMKRDTDENVYIDGIIEDVTKNKNLEDQLIQAQKMEAIGQLAGGISHDFNNILTAIIGYGTILLMKREDDELIKKNTGNILALCDKAANLTQGLLTFSKRHQMNMDIYNLNEIVKSSGRMVERIIGETITVKISITADELMVKADFSQIEQVLLNLATNSRDAMPEGGTLTLSTSLVSIDEQYITSHGYGEPGNYALITFSDTGSGIEDNLKMKIFDPFFTTKEVGKGTGLGLSIVFGIIKQHNGFIDLFSEPGKGTTFNIYIPITGMVSEKKMPIGFPIQKEKKVTILIAEDEEEVRSVMAKTLSEFGYNVIEAIDGEDAITKFIENKNSIRLLFFDIVMPNKNGLESYAEIMKIKPDIKVIFTSGYSLDIAQVNKMQEYGSDFIPKPISPTVLYKKVKEALNSLTPQKTEG